MLDAAKTLEPTLEEEQLLFFPYWVNVCIEHITDVGRVVDLLVGQYSSREDRYHLVESAIEAGMGLIRYWGSREDKNILSVL